MSHQVLTRKGYDFFEVSSTVQKAVRRGDERVALYFATELAGSGYAKYLWKRMLIMASEDIGLADNTVAVTINALYQNWQIIAEKNHEEGIIPITHAMLLLIRSSKSRIVDNAKMYCLKNGDRMEIPDYALDVHTRRGKMMGRGYEYFLKEGSKLENEVQIEDEEFYQKFFADYMMDTKCPDYGYDEGNIYYKSIRDMPPRNLFN